MSNLEEFRKETRSWLEENCPQSMRTPTPEEEVIWGGRKQEWVNLRKHHPKAWEHAKSLEKQASDNASAFTWIKDMPLTELEKPEVIAKVKEQHKKQKLSKQNTIVIGNNLKSLKSAKKEAENLGYNTLILTSQIKGEAKVVAKSLASIALEIKNSNIPIEKPACLIVGGETSVKVKGSGLGGRNSEIALAFAIEITNEDKISALFAGTDGIDGITDAAGAYCNGASRIKSRKAGVSAKDSLINNDSYSFFKKAGDLKITGPTGTNVNDVGIIFIEEYIFIPFTMNRIMN